MGEVEYGVVGMTRIHGLFTYPPPARACAGPPFSFLSSVAIMCSQDGWNMLILW